ncbi:AAA domain-containing protein, partial [Balamuthia mandrillaris]
MDKGANRVTHDRMMEALAIFTSNEVIPENSVSTNSGESCRGGSSSSSQSKSGSSSTSSASSSSNSRAASSSSASSSKKEVMMGGTLLRNIILGNVWGNDYKAAAAKPPEGLSEYYKKSNFPPDFDTWRLNDSQRQVIRSVLTRRLTLIQGPPGTGKTFTAIHLMRLLVHLCKSRVPVLCTADTNVAVDNLLQGLSDFGIRALRVGRPVKVREELRGLSLDAQILAHPRTAELTKLRDRTVELSNQIPELKDSAKYDALVSQLKSKATVKSSNLFTSKRNIAHMDLQSTWAKLKELESRIAKEILDGAQVICATCIGAGHELLRNRQFPIVILDDTFVLPTLESTQATEPASLCPLVHGSKHVVLMGDHFQLPPTVISPKGQEGGLGESLFSRLIKLGITTHMLEIQYR